MFIIISKYTNIETCQKLENVTILFTIHFIKMAANSRVFVYGGKGALGSQLVNFYKSKNWVNC